MKKTQSKSQFSAFTLIELLVVIAIIGILAGLLFPAIQGALQNANALRVGNNGRSVVLSIISANTEREAMSLGTVWPGKKSDFAGAVDYTAATDSETYFSDLITSEAVENLSWSVFSGGGVQAAPDQTTFEAGDHNVWNMIAGLDESSADDTPFLFTRNFAITDSALQDDTSSMRSLFTADAKPFGGSLVVFVQKGAAMQNLKSRYLANPRLFLGGATFNSATNANAKIVMAKSTTK